MSEPRIVIYFDGNRRVYPPGSLLAGEYVCEGVTEVKAVELAALWHTRGKGDEDLAVHFFERREGQADAPLQLRSTQRFAISLPASPLSYEGVLLKIRWCVRVRLFLPRAKELLAEEPFRLGSVPPGREVLHERAK